MQNLRVKKTEKAAKKCWANMLDIINQKQNQNTNPADNWNNQTTSRDSFVAEVARRIGNNKASLQNVRQTIEECYSYGNSVAQTVQKLK